MKPIYDAWLIQIDITNACHKRCAHCTRAVSHFTKPYFADLGFVEKALQSLAGWKRGVGCMGGEPTLHPEFPEICALFNKYFPRNRCGICTAGGIKYEEHKKLLYDTFGIVHYHNHSVPAFHQPLMVASREIVRDEQLRRELIGDCWLQRKWCPSITIKGCFFCEVAGTFDLLFDGPGGYPIEPGWWKKNEHQFADQVERYCGLCSIPVPMVTLPEDIPYEYVSKENAMRLEKVKSPLALKGNLRIIDEDFTREKIRRIRESEEYKTPFHYQDRKRSNYRYTAPLIAKIWGRNVNYELKQFVKSGNIIKLVRNVFEI